MIYDTRFAASAAIAFTLGSPGFVLGQDQSSGTFQIETLARKVMEKSSDHSFLFQGTLHDSRPVELAGNRQQVQTTFDVLLEVIDSHNFLYQSEISNTGSNPIGFGEAQLGQVYHFVNHPLKKCQLFPTSFRSAGSLWKTTSLRPGMDLIRMAFLIESAPLNELDLEVDTESSRRWRLQSSERVYDFFLRDGTLHMIAGRAGNPAVSPARIVSIAPEDDLLSGTGLIRRTLVWSQIVAGGVEQAIEQRIRGSISDYEHWVEISGTIQDYPESKRHLNFDLQCPENYDLEQVMADGTIEPAPMGQERLMLATASAIEATEARFRNIPQEAPTLPSKGRTAAWAAIFFTCFAGMLALLYRFFKVRRKGTVG